MSVANDPQTEAKAQMRGFLDKREKDTDWNQCNVHF